MKALFWILGLAALAVGISLVARFNNGYLLIVIPPYRGEISLNLAVLLAVLGFAAGYVLLRVVSLALSLPRHARESRARRRREKAAELFGDCVRQYLAGDRRKVIATAEKLRDDATWAALAAALAARASCESGDVEKPRDGPSRGTGQDPAAAGGAATPGDDVPAV